MAPRLRLLALGAGVATSAAVVAAPAPHSPAGPAGRDRRRRARAPTAGIALGGSPRVVGYALLGGLLLHPTSPAALTGIGPLVGMTLGTPLIVWLARRRLVLVAHH